MPRPPVIPDVLPHPKSILEQLDRRIVEQTYAKITLAIAVRNHLKRLQIKESRRVCKLKPVNILLLGPTGSGKTLIAETLASILKLPFVQQDATMLSQSGYKGEDIVGIFQKLINAASGNIKWAERGIVYIDEIDKIVSKPRSANHAHISNEGVQQGLLTALNGSKMEVPVKGLRQIVPGESVGFNTSDILFIAGGAFVGIEEIIAKGQCGTGLTMGLTAKSVGSALDADDGDTYKLLKDVSHKDLISAGLIPELVGRFPVLVPFHKLSKVALRKVITEPEDSVLDQALAFLEGDVDVEVTDGAIDRIADEAYSSPTGARAIQSILSETLMWTNFTLPRAVRITAESVINRHQINARLCEQEAETAFRSAV